MSRIDERYLRARLDHTRLSRRELLRGLLHPVTASFAATPPPRQQRETPRPPQAQEETLLARLCSGCGACATVCSNQIISMEHGLPRLNLEHNHCDLCLACTAACETRALAPELPAMTGLIPEFNDNCVLSYGESCTLCQQACPGQAITLPATGLPLVSAEYCQGCSRCVQSCYASGCHMHPLPV
ncbi:4Fe-4S dicluster domain-containing protein [Vreelandella olivaria]|uniref:4Fe-4S dicluster domain-containing protein n=1 Tax=Vreelandella olivaria TaxID=390919 RepID=UPI00201E94A7|nr:4Fe-4S dicluster domain-containing protein [Halomonas olivaria]